MKGFDRWIKLIICFLKPDGLQMLIKCSIMDSSKAKGTKMKQGRQADDRLRWDQREMLRISKPVTRKDQTNGII